MGNGLVINLFAEVSKNKEILIIIICTNIIEVIIDCGTLTNPQYGIVTLTGTSPGSIATYHCNNGFVLNGDQERQCSETGVWSGDEPLCEGKTTHIY